MIYKQNKPPANTFPLLTPPGVKRGRRGGGRGLKMKSVRMEDKTITSNPPATYLPETKLVSFWPCFFILGNMESLRICLFLGPDARPHLLGAQGRTTATPLAFGEPAPRQGLSNDGPLPCAARSCSFYLYEGIKHARYSPRSSLSVAFTLWS